MMRQRTVSQKKIDEVAHLKQMINKSRVVGLAHLAKMPANSLQDLRASLRKDVTIHMTKKRLAKRAFSEANKENLLKLGEKMTEITALLFTDMDPVKLAKFLETKAVKGPARAGDIAPIDIEVPEGDTKIAAGPIISELSGVLKLPAMVKNQTIHIRTKTVTHKKGTVIKEKEAQLLTRLGIQPMDIKLDFYCAWENGEILSKQMLQFNPEQIIDDVKTTFTQVMILAMKCDIFVPELSTVYLQKTVQEAAALENIVFGEKEVKQEKQSSTSEEKEEPKKQEEDTGLGSLFG